jgi:hypothetical protein
MLAKIIQQVATTLVIFGILRIGLPLGFSRGD